MIYLDNHATTPTDPRVLAAMLPYFHETFGNPSSTSHAAGRIAGDAIEEARKQVAKLIGARAREIVFTSGATESNNLVIQGLARGSIEGRKRIITTSIEHKAVLAPAHALEDEGYQVVILPVKADGRVDLDVARAVIDDNTLLVSVQAASNEIGTIQPIAELAAIAHEHGAFFHTDAAQAVGKIPVNVNEWDVDLLSISSHKLYGPKGVGVLYIRGGPYAYPIKSLFYGGGQEHELRPGTLNVPAIVGLGDACRIAMEGLAEEQLKTAALRDRFEQKILLRVESVRRNGALDSRLPGNSSLTFPGIDAEALIMNVPELAISTGSACTSGAPEPSHVLTAIGLSRKDAYSTIRIGIGRFTTEEELDRAADMIVDAVQRLVGLQASQYELSEERKTVHIREGKQSASSLSRYAAKFADLRTDKAEARWDETTYNQAPHKPFLLLAVIDLFAKGKVSSNLIRFADLEELFDTYWNVVKPMGRLRYNMVLPFFHLQSDGFWHLIPRHGREQVLTVGEHIRSVSVLEDNVQGAKMDDELFDILCTAHGRETLREVLVKTYFHPDFHQQLLG